MPRTRPTIATFRAVLSPVDFSDQSRAALRAAARIAARSQGHLVVLFVNDPLLEAAAAAALDERGLAATAARDLRRFVQGALPAAMRARVRVRCVTAVGSPASEIGRNARREGCDLVVLATQGLGGARKLLFGSTTQAVLRKTTVPVLALPPRGADGANRLAPPSWPPRRLVVPIDLGPYAGTDIAAAAAVARGFDARMQLVHVVPMAAAVPRDEDGPMAPLQRALQTTTSRLNTLAIAAGAGDVVSKCRAVAGDPPETIALIAARERGALIVLTLRGRGGLTGTRAGAITYHVLKEGAAPVLALPPGATFAQAPGRPRGRSRTTNASMA